MGLLDDLSYETVQGTISEHDLWEQRRQQT